VAFRFKEKTKGARILPPPGKIPPPAGYVLLYLNINSQKVSKELSPILVGYNEKAAFVEGKILVCFAIFGIIY